jgi:hypothetical protein
MHKIVFMLYAENQENDTHKMDIIIIILDSSFFYSNYPRFLLAFFINTLMSLQN